MKRGQLQVAQWDWRNVEQVFLVSDVSFPFLALGGPASRGFLEGLGSRVGDDSAAELFNFFGEDPEVREVHDAVIFI